MASIPNIKDITKLPLLYDCWILWKIAKSRGQKSEAEFSDSVAAAHAPALLAKFTSCMAS